MKVPSFRTTPRYDVKKGRDTQHGSNPDRESYMEFMIKFVEEHEQKRRSLRRKRRKH